MSHWFITGASIVTQKDLDIMRASVKLFNSEFILKNIQKL